MKGLHSYPAPIFTLKPSSDILFMRKKCAEWLIRCLDFQDSVVGELFKVLEWTLGRPLDDLAGNVREWLADGKGRTLGPLKRERIEETMAEIDECPTVATEALETVANFAPQSLLRVLATHARVALSEYLEQEPHQGGSDLEHCLDQFRKLLGLSAHESELCLLLYCRDKVHSWERYFEDEFEATRTIGRNKLCHTLGISMTELRRILSGKLAKLNILDADSRLSLSSSYVAFLENGDADDLTRELFSVQRGGSLALSDYVLDPAELGHVCSLLGSPGSTPTHILLYGAPGTGKSSFARSLARKLGLQAYNVALPKDSDQDTRRAGIEACLNITANGSTGLVVVDEADNLLNTVMSFLLLGQGQDKGWLNELLERPGVRMVWITNSIDGIEQSVRRRFAYSVQFQPLGIKQRVRLWRNVLKKNKATGLLDPDQIGELAKKFNLSAGYIDLAVKKALESKNRQPAQFRRAVELSLKAGLTLANDGEPAEAARTMDRNYSLEGINVGCDLDGFMTRLERFDRGLRNKKAPHANMNLLFYGPPGTGKTELAKYVAQRLERELVTRRASELLAPYVGMTEQRIAEAFRSAEKDEAVLLIDEADSFIFDRSLAVRSWEVTAVNEFLTQMERFRGLLICTTNRMEQLDSASMRRFNQKIGFDYLTGDGNVIFYRRMLAPLIHGRPTKDVLNPLCHCSNLAPGDFKIVRDRFSFYSQNELTHETLVQALLEESQIKANRNRTNPIGFNRPSRK
ncbi:MAG TPA: hypothetical protein DDZ34_08485 [Syntrophaceae bacterium]|nr:hypothetical protein [Syntrophaceae bacterium]